MSGAELPVLRHPKHNDTSFKPGISPWPGGKRSKGFQALKQAARERMPAVLAAADKALALDPPTTVTYLYSKLLAEYAEGKPIQMVHVDGELEIKISERMRVARDRMRKIVLEGVAEAISEVDAAEDAATLRLTP